MVIVLKHDLAIAVELRFDNVDRLVGVLRHETAFCQLLRKKRSDHFGPFHAYDCIDDHIVQIHMYECLGNSSRLTQTALYRRQVKIVIRVGKRKIPFTLGHFMLYCEQ